MNWPLGQEVNAAQETKWVKWSALSPASPLIETRLEKRWILNWWWAVISEPTGTVSGLSERALNSLSQVQPPDGAAIDSGNQGRKEKICDACNQSYTFFIQKTFHTQQILLQYPVSCHSSFQSTVCDLAWSYHLFQITFGPLRLFSR